jgi:uncharacterized GH25 family protein
MTLPCRWILLLSALSLTASALAHETWLLPASFAAKEGEEIHIDATTGEHFPTFETSIRPDRIAILSARLGMKQLDLKTFEPKDKSLSIRQSFPNSGLATVWLELKPKDIELSDAKVAEYLDDIAATDDVRGSWAAQKGKAPWRETYVKHAKTWVAVGDPKDDASWQTPVGMKLELVPLGSPFSATSGKDFGVQLLADGKPLPKWPIGLMIKGMKEHELVVSDAEGKATFRLTQAGEAMIFTVHLRQEAKSQHWQSDFTTITFAVRQAE